MKEDYNLTILPTDGAQTCIWKIMQFEGWKTSGQIAEMLSSYHYGTSCIRAMLGKMSSAVIRKRKAINSLEKKPIYEYKLVENAPKPSDRSRASPGGKNKSVAFDPEKERKIKVASDNAVHQMSLMMRQALPPR